MNGTLTVAGDSTYNESLTLATTHTATASTSYNSPLIKFFASAYNSSTKAAVSPHFEWQVEPAGNNTAAPNGTLNLLATSGVGGIAETGFYLNTNGTIHFASGQTFPGTGPGTITGVTAGTDLTGGGTSGHVTLNLDTTKIPTLAQRIPLPELRPFSAATSTCPRQPVPPTESSISAACPFCTDTRAVRQTSLWEAPAILRPPGRATRGADTPS